MTAIFLAMPSVVRESAAVSGPVGNKIFTKQPADKPPQLIRETYDLAKIGFPKVLGSGIKPTATQVAEIGAPLLPELALLRNLLLQSLTSKFLSDQRTFSLALVRKLIFNWRKFSKVRLSVPNLVKLSESIGFPLTSQTVRNAWSHLQLKEKALAPALHRNRLARAINDENRRQLRLKLAAAYKAASEEFLPSLKQSVRPTLSSVIQKLRSIDPNLKYHDRYIAQLLARNRQVCVHKDQLRKKLVRILVKNWTELDSRPLILNNLEVKCRELGFDFSRSMIRKAWRANKNLRQSQTFRASLKRFNPLKYGWSFESIAEAHKQVSDKLSSEFGVKLIPSVRRVLDLLKARDPSLTAKEDSLRGVLKRLNLPFDSDQRFNQQVLQTLVVNRNKKKRLTSSKLHAQFLELGYDIAPEELRKTWYALRKRNKSLPSLTFKKRRYDYKFTPDRLALIEVYRAAQSPNGLTYFHNFLRELEKHPECPKAISKDYAYNIEKRVRRLNAHLRKKSRLYFCYKPEQSILKEVVSAYRKQYSVPGTLKDLTIALRKIGLKVGEDDLRSALSEGAHQFFTNRIAQCIYFCRLQQSLKAEQLSEWQLFKLASEVGLNYDRSEIRKALSI